MNGTIKDKITNICGLVSAVGGSLLAFFVSTPEPEPTWLTTSLGAIVAVAVALIGWYTGKNSQGKKKTK